MREAFDVWVNVYPPLPVKYQNAFRDTITAHETREDALNDAGHSCLATCLLRFDGEQLKTILPDVNQAVGGGGRVNNK